MKNFTSLLILFFAFSAYSQNFSGKAIYKTSRKSNFKIKADKSNGMTDDMQEEIRKRMQKMNQKTYILNFDRNTSTYKEEAKLANPQKPQMGGARVMVMSFGGSGSGSVYYKNTQENRFVNQTEIMGKRFLVKDTLPKYDWVLSSEKKNIGKYTCYKATYTTEVENVRMTINDGESQEEKVTETVVTTAWYTTQIPISNGPDNFQGLPGLILEINDGKRMIVCTEIEMSTSDKNLIKEPVKGKIVSQNEYEKISREKSKEMLEQFKSRKGVNMGNGVNIKIGG